jgi:hypothetical protein
MVYADIGLLDTDTADDSSSSSSSGSETQDISGMPFRFNPPLHPSARHIRPDLASDDPLFVYTEPNSLYPANSLSDDAAKSAFTSLRLGRLVMGNMAMSWALADAKERFGFRFLYNPEKVQRGATVGTDFIPDPENTLNFVLQEGLERITFELLLNRIPDVNGPSNKNDYSPAIRQSDWDQIQRRGTHYDLEFLYRVANGLQNTQVRQNTGDIGLLLPNPCWLILGRQKTRGALESIQANDQLFSKSLVPTLTRVTITFARFLTTNMDDIASLEAVGITSQGGGLGSTTTDDTTPVSNVTPGSGTLTGREVYDLCRSVGFTESQAEVMVSIAWGESSWRVAPSPHPACCWGLFQINWDAHQSWLKRDFGLKKAEDLHDPKVNAKAARQLYVWAGNYNDWEAYTGPGWGRTKFKWRR